MTSVPVALVLRLNNRVAVTAALLLVASACAADPHVPGQFEHHPDIAIQLWAAEPLVIDPVAVAFTADGSCFVAEMRDYPFGIGPDRRPGGAVRRLRDTDGDGVADQSDIFADGLSFPTSVLPWKKGVLVLAPPHLLYLEDTNADGQADRREVMVEGFALGVTDSNANSLRFGLDGLVHVANGGNGGRLWFPGAEGEPVSLGRADVALDLRRRTVHRTYETAGGFGLATDGAGHRFVTYNIDYLQQQVLPLEQLERAGDVAAFAATESISDQGPSARLFPVVAAATRVNHPEQAGRFSSAGGTGFLDGTPFAPRLAGSVFVCDVVTNLVHRDLVREEGPTFRAARAAEEQDSEFIASRDPACRPVGLEHGPDGGMYLIDMQRDVIEHPDYIPAATLATLDLRAGSDRGRIYRVEPRAGLESADRPIAELATADLVAELGHSFRWRRETAHRLLAEKLDEGARERETGATANDADGIIGRLHAALTTASLPEARLRAGWLLAAAGRLDDHDLEQALADASPEVRENAVAWLRKRGEAGRLVSLLDDTHPRVRFTAALALDGQPAAGKTAALGRMLRHDVSHAWSRRAVALAVDNDAADMLALAWQAAGGADEAAWREAVRELAFTAASAAGRQDRLDHLLDQIEPDAASHAVEPLLAGLLAGWRRHPEVVGDKARLTARISRWSGPAWLSAGGPHLVPTLLDLAVVASADRAHLPPALVDRIEAARHILGDGAAERPAAAERLAAVEILARAPGSEATDALVALLARPEPGEIQRAAIAGLQRRRQQDLGERLIAAWPRLGPTIRPQVVALLVADRRFHAALLGAIETGAIGLGEVNLDLEQRRTLRRGTSPDLALRAALLLGDEEYANRRPLVTEWLARMPAEGDPTVGREVFRERCGSCHVAHGVGHRVGPDLEALSHRSVEDLASHVLDPNMAINPGYVSCVVELEDGRTLTGLLAVDGADAVTILQQESKQITVPRTEIADLRMLSTSLMPEGLDRLLTPDQLRAVIAFIQAR